MTDILERPARQPDEVIRYADHDCGVLDIYAPSSGSRGLVVFIHGGFWKAAYDRTHARPLADALARSGWTVALPEYRRVGHGGGWPTTLQDVRAALDVADTIRASSAAPAAVPDTTPGTRRLVGHSAGGHLALLAAAPQDRVVALAPVADLVEADRLGLGGGAVAAFLGGHDPAPADPMRHSRSRDVRILHGSQDENVPIAISERFAAAHPEASLLELPGGHFELIDPLTDQFAAVVSALD